MFQKPTNRKKRRRAGRKAKSFGNCTVIKFDKCSASWRKMMTRRKKHIQYVGFEKWNSELKAMQDVMDNMLGRLYEATGIKDL